LPICITPNPIEEIGVPLSAAYTRL